MHFIIIYFPYSLINYDLLLVQNNKSNLNKCIVEMKTKYSYGKTYLIIVFFEEYLVFNLEVLTFVDL